MVRKPAYKAFKLDDKELKSALGADGHFGGRGGSVKVPAPGVYRAIICDVEKGEYCFKKVFSSSFFAQAMTSVTRFLCELASSTATKFITDAMQKLTLTVIRRKDGERRFVLSNFNL